jgi:hypothetical protein
MEARKVAARFAAYTWYEENRKGRKSSTESARFAQENWKTFLPVVPEGLGRLLIEIAAGPPDPARVQNPRRRSELAAV